MFIQSASSPSMSNTGAAAAKAATALATAGERSPSRRSTAPVQTAAAIHVAVLSHLAQIVASPPANRSGP